MLAQAASSGYSGWVVLAIVLGAGGFGGGLIWMARMFFGMRDLLIILRGRKGGDGLRAVTSLVDLVDSHSEQLQAFGDKLSDLHDLLVEVTRQVTPNGGDTDSFADQFLRTMAKLEGKTLLEDEDSDS